MVQSHATGGMSEHALLTWLQTTDNYSACAALIRAAVLMEDIGKKSVTVLSMTNRLLQAAEDLLEALLDNGRRLSWNTYLRLSAAVLEAYDDCLIEMQSVCCNQAVLMRMNSLNARNRNRHSMDICMHVMGTPRRSNSERMNI